MINANTKYKKFLISLTCFVIVAIGPLIYNIVGFLLNGINLMPKERSFIGLISLVAYYIGIIIAFISKDYISINVKKNFF